MREERVCFILWFLRDKDYHGMEGTAASRHGGKSGKLSSHICAHIQETERVRKTEKKRHTEREKQRKKKKWVRL